MLIEVCANSLESARNAQEAGADRIELCTALGLGGITPSFGLLQKVREEITIPVRVLIRPRGGDFIYSETEFEIMKANIAHCVDLGFDGVVSGILNANFDIDLNRTRQLRDCSKDKGFTFHRAFDWVNNPIDALSVLESIGVDTILTSGQKAKAINGISLLKTLQDKAKKCTILVGGGIDLANASIFKQEGFSNLHLSGTVVENKVDLTGKISMNSSAHLEEHTTRITSKERIKDIVKLFG